MRDFLHGITSFFIRISAFVSKEFFTMISQPRLLGVLILGPFLILLIFGISYRDIYRTLRTTIVVPDDENIAASVQAFAEQPMFGVNVVDISTHAAGALSALENRVVDLVMVVPEDAYQKITHNQQAAFTFYHHEIDPFEVTYVDFVTQRITEETNRQLMLAAVEKSKAQLRDYQAEIHALQESQPGASEENIQTGPTISTNRNAPAGAGAMWFLLQALGGQLPIPRTGENTAHTASPPGQPDSAALKRPDLAEIDAELDRLINANSQVIVEPFRRETQSLNLATIQPFHFYVPAVLALLLQHIAVSLAGLSIVSERFAGTMELMRAAPVNAFEVLLGKYFSFLVFLGMLAALLTALVHWGLGVPLLGSLSLYALAVFLVIFVSLGFGFLISTLANSDSQAIQIAMVLLLASIFFSGFFLPLYRLWWPAQSVSWAMPATYGLKTLQDIMLRGARPEMWLFGILGGLGLMLFLVNWLRLRSLMVQR